MGLLLLRQALVGLRAAPIRSGLGLLVSAIAVVVLLIGFAMSDIAHARDVRVSERSPVTGVAGGPTNRLLYRDRSSFYEDRAVAAHEVAVQGTTPLVPAGLETLPRPGELAASPAMQALLRDASTTLARRYPGTVTQVIGPAGLVGPRELVIWIGVTPEQIGPDAVPIRSFGNEQPNFSLPAELGPARALLVVGFLVPLVALLVTCATIGGAQRERRLSALRLLGLTKGQVKFATAAEAGLLALAGCALGVVLLWALRGAGAPLAPVNGGVWPSDVRLDPVVIAGVAVGLAGLAIVAAFGALRTVLVTPLAVTRRAASSMPRTWRVLPLAAGTALLGFSLLPTSIAPLPVTVRSLLVVVAIGLCVLGLLLGSSWLIYRFARRLERLSWPVGVALGLRQVTQATSRSARTVTGLGALVLISGLLISFFPLFADVTASAQRDFTAEVGNSTLVANVPPDVAVDLERLQATPGVVGAAMLWQLPVQTSPSATGTKADGLVRELLAVDCEDLRTTLGVSVDDCQRSLLVDGRQPLRPTASGTFTVTPRQDLHSSASSTVVGTIEAPTAPAAAPIVHSLVDAYALSAGLVVPVRDLSADVASQLYRFPAQLVVRQDDSRREAVRTAVITATGGRDALTTGESLAIAEKSTRTYRGLTLTALASAALVAGLSLLISSVDQMREQRRVLSALWVVGARRRTLVGSVLTKTGALALPTLLLALALALLAAKGYLSLTPTPPAVPTGQILAAFAACLVAPFVAGIAGMSMLRSTRTPHEVGE